MATDEKQTKSVARRVREQVARGGTRIWRVEDFDGPPSAVNNELRRLVKRGELERLRRGVYWHGRRTRFGMVAAAQTDTVKKVVGSDEALGATGWYATNLLGLSTQVAPVETLAITSRRPEGLDKVRVTTRAARTERRRAKLNGLEVTFLEALQGWHRYVELPSDAALDRFVDLLQRDDIRVDRLVRASQTEPASVRERLRAVLRHAGHLEAAEAVPAARDPRTTERALEVLRGSA
jgi:hypothetical protein